MKNEAATTYRPLTSAADGSNLLDVAAADAYILDGNGRLHRPNGQFASRDERTGWNRIVEAYAAAAQTFFMLSQATVLSEASYKVDREDVTYRPVALTKAESNHLRNVFSFNRPINF